MMRRVPMLALALSIGPAFGQATDPLEIFDRALFAGVAIDQCHLALGWQPSQARLGEIGKAAYDQLLSERNASNPDDPKNDRKADYALRVRMERVAREAAETIRDLGCSQIE